MSDILNMLITVLGIAVFIYIVTAYYPEIERLLEEKLKFRLSNANSNQVIIGEIFYKYRHKNSKAWIQWIKSQEKSVQNTAIGQMLNHLEKEVETWGGVTYEAIIALGHFENQDFLSYLKMILIKCKKFWEKYKICKKCYEAALIASIKLNEEEAIKILTNEVNNINLDSQAESIIEAVKTFDPDAKYEDLIINILCNENIGYQVKTNLFNFIFATNEESALEIILAAANQFLNIQRTFDVDELRLIDDFLFSLIENLNDERYMVLLKACSHQYAAAPALRVIKKALQKDPEVLNSEQKNILMNTEYDKSKLIETTLIEINKLNPEEIKVIINSNLSQKYPFTKKIFIEENQDVKLTVPTVAKDVFNKFKTLLKQAHITQKGSAGLLLSGDCDEEKLFFARTLASEKKWKFFYFSLEELINNSASNETRAYIERINSNKPCIVYLDGVEVLHTQSEKMPRTLVQLTADHGITLVGSTNTDINIIENNKYQLKEENELIESLFARAYEILRPDESEKQLLLSSKLHKLDISREHHNHEELKILEPTKNHSLFEFDQYLSQYFKTSLLTTGKLIDSNHYQEFEKERLATFANQTK